jgi:predicted nucleic acid-binding protein
MIVLFDTNIVLDLFLDRKPFVLHSQTLFSYVENGKIDGYLGATTVTTLDYLLTKSLSQKEVSNIMRKLLKLFQVAPVNRMVLEEAIDSGFNDFEDAVLHAAGVHCGVQAIVTRNEKDFKKSALAVYTPEDLLNILDLV